MKKFFSLVLALVMALSLTTVAWGADPVAKVGTTEFTDLQAAVDAAALDASKTVTLLDDVTVTATTIGGRLVGINVPAGVTVDGDGYTLTVDGAYSSAGGTNCAVLFHGGTLKDITIVGGNRCIFMDTIDADVVFDNIVIDTEGSYGFNTGYTGGLTAYTFTATDSVFSGWNSYGAHFASVTFTNCEFVKNADGICVLRPYNDTTVEDCNFAKGAEIHTEMLAPGEKIELEDVTVAGEPVTAANAATLLGDDAATVTVTSVATTSYNVYDANGDLAVANTTYTAHDGVATDRDTGIGVVDYYTVADMADRYFVEVAKADKADADYYVTLVGQDGVRFYLKEVVSPEYILAKEFNDIGTECDQLPGNKKYDYFVYVHPVTEEDVYVVACKLADAEYNVMVGGELIAVKETGMELVYHDWAIKTINDKHEVVAIECEDCGAVANVYDSKLAAPKGAWKDDTYGWIALVAPTASTTPSTDKVESAETFDAGIAMYVGMSVMAAAGSAVVIGKKKD